MVPLQSLLPFLPQLFHAIDYFYLLDCFQTIISILSFLSLSSFSFSLLFSLFQLFSSLLFLSFVSLFLLLLLLLALPFPPFKQTTLFYTSLHSRFLSLILPPLFATKILLFTYPLFVLFLTSFQQQTNSLFFTALILQQAHPPPTFSFACHQLANTLLKHKNKT